MSMTGDLIRVDDQLDVYFQAVEEAKQEAEAATKAGDQEAAAEALQRVAQLELVLRSAVVEHASRVDSIVNWFDRSDLEIEYLERREISIKDKQEEWRKKQITVRQILAAHLDMHEIKKLPGRETKGITFVKGATRVEILDTPPYAQIPAKFKTVKVVETVHVDKRAIKAALDSAEEVPGAALCQGPPTVRVR